jgi:hypothetical protein
MGPPAKKSRTNTPWTPAEEQRLKTMRDAGNSWADIAKVKSEQKWRLGWHKTQKLTFLLLDVSKPNRRQCKEALVQGTIHRQG